MKNSPHILLILIVLPCLISCKQKADLVKEKPPVTVNVLIAGKVSFPTSIEVNGTALSEESVDIYPEVSGRLTYLNIPDGASVSKGTILARINDAELQAQLEQQNIQLALAEKTEQRMKALLAVNGVNQSEYDAALSQVNTIKANINVLNAQIDKTIVRAAFSGRLGLRLVSQGAFVNTQTLLGTLQQTDKIKIDFTVPEIYSDLVKVGNTITILTNDSGEKSTAVISAIEPRINPETRNIKARARLEHGNISPGAFVKVTLDKSQPGILVPSNAIIPNANSNQVILVKNNKAVYTNVETGIRNVEAVEILKGINPGDSVIVSGVLFVRPNAAIRIGKVDSSFREVTQVSKESEK